MLTIGNEKANFTVMLSACADGRKLRPYVLLERKTPIPDLERLRARVCVEYGTSGWMDDGTTKQYLMRVVGQPSMFSPRKRRLLVWDSFRSHISVSTKDVMAKLKIDAAIVPGGCTKYVQPADVYWNGKFKHNMRERYKIWLATADKQTTRGGNVKGPDVVTVCKWIAESWEAIPTEVSLDLDN